VQDFYVEQALATPLTAAAEQALLGRLISCGHEYGARFRDFLVDVEHQRIVCRVEADNLQSARAALRCSGLEPDATWVSAVYGLRSGAPDAPADANACATTANGVDGQTALVDVIAECRHDGPIDATKLARACDWCLDTFRVQPGPLIVSTDGRRILAFFRAPDAEAVRACYRQASVPFDRVVALRRLDASVSS
jgi:hypothetical protein